MLFCDKADNKRSFCGRSGAMSWSPDLVWTALHINTILPTSHDAFFLLKKVPKNLPHEGTVY